VRTGSAPERELAAWERRRLASARTAAALATLNTSLGRALGPRAQTVRRAALRAALRPPGALLLAHAYSMGFDRDA
jgi:2-polyprenyl-6-methoxyphenol hydroxylase-like FAD-dependent oxidoreductase